MTLGAKPEPQPQSVILSGPAPRGREWGGNIGRPAKDLGGEAQAATLVS